MIIAIKPVQQNVSFIVVLTVMWLLLRKKSADVRLILVRLTRCKSLTGSVVMQITASDLKARNGAVEIVVQSISREITMRKTLQDIIQATD